MAPRLPLTTPVLLRNGVTAVVSGHNPNDSRRHRVSWFNTRLWRVEHKWLDRSCFEVMKTAPGFSTEAEAASA